MGQERASPGRNEGRGRGWGENSIVGKYGRSRNAPKGIHVLTPGTRQSYLQKQKELCICDAVEDLEMGRLSWVIWVGPKYKCPCKRETEGDLTSEEEKAV